MRETKVRRDGWCEGGLRQQRNDGGGCATMLERPERVEPWYICNGMSFNAAIFAWPSVLSDRPPMLWWLSDGEGRDAVT